MKKNRLRCAGAGGSRVRVERKIAFQCGSVLVRNRRWQNTSSSVRFDFRTKSSGRLLM